MSECDKHSCEGCANAGNCHSQQQKEMDAKVAAALEHVQRVMVVMSGKGGVGKSTVAVNLAVSAAAKGLRVGLLDVDLHGPSVPTMLGAEGVQLQSDGTHIIPYEVAGVKVVSVGFMLANQDDPVVWRGPVKIGVIQQFITEVDWGELDLLVIDVPPGTGDEPLTALQLTLAKAQAVIVTTPQKVAAVDVRKSVSFCKALKVPVAGVVENMSGFICPHCGKVTPIFKQGGGEQIAVSMDVPFLGAIPMDVAVAAAGDAGRAFTSAAANDATASVTQAAFREVLQRLGV